LCCAGKHCSAHQRGLGGGQSSLAGEDAEHDSVAADAERDWRAFDKPPPDAGSRKVDRLNA